jgi:sugar phosphate isomerase/epimerase
MKWGAESMHMVGDYARQLGITVAVEYLTHWELPGMNTVQSVAEFLKQVDHPAIGALVDSSHETLDGAGPTAFAHCLAEVIEAKRHVHVHASATHRGSLQYTWINWDFFFLLLLKAGWDKGGDSIIATEEFNAVPPFLNGVKLTRAEFPNLFMVAVASLEVVRESFGNARAALRGEKPQRRLSKLEIAALA